MKKIFFISFLLFSFLSCTHDVNYVITKKDADYADLYTNRDAYSIYYYKQPVTGETDISAWIRDTESDVTSTYVPAGSSVSSLNNKAYEGFIFAGIVENNMTINVYYKRCTISYEFYETYGDTVPVYKVQGLYGMHAIKPLIQDRDESYFNAWVTKNQEPYTTEFTINADSNTLNNVSTTKWYATWTEKNSVLGLGMNLTEPGDLLLRDGSIIPAGRYDIMSPEQINAVVGILITNSYEPENGRNTEGTVRLIAGLKPGSGTWIDGSWNDSKGTNYYKTEEFQTSDRDGQLATETILTIDKEYRKNSNRDNAVLYSLDYDIHAGVSLNYRNEWYLPSLAEAKLLLTDTFISAYTTLGILTEGAEFWTSTTKVPGSQVNTCLLKTGDNIREKKKYDETCYIIAFRQIN